MKFILVGEDVSRSASPYMMNAALKKLGIDGEYKSFSLSRVAFQLNIRHLISTCDGLNVTMPYKQQIIPYLSSLDSTASRIQAVNTVKVKGGPTGYNTDIDGIINPLRERGIQPSAALLLGSGGAARAFFESMNRIGCKRIAVAVRNFERGESFLREMKLLYKESKFTLHSIYSDLPDDVDLIFNATPLGRKGLDLPRTVIKSINDEVAVFDSVYDPLETELVSVAKDKGCNVIQGYEMLVHQGAAALRIWTGKSPPIAEMMQAAVSFLEGVLA